MTAEIRPCDDADQLREYIDAYWRKGHVLATDEAMFRFTYCTPWVDRAAFPAGISVLGLYDGQRMTGFLGSITAPYPRPRSYWLALWHVLPEMKGTGLGGRLLAAMQSIALASDGWIGTFGAGPEALPVYLKRGYCVRAARRWVYSPTEGQRMSNNDAIGEPALNASEQPAPEEWFAYRYDRHPVHAYDRRPSAVFRTETNDWGRVTHVCWLGPQWESDVRGAYRQASAAAQDEGCAYVMDLWAFERPGAGWTLAPEALPSVFHPPEARGNVTYAVGRPFLMTTVHKGDCDQDRPNGVVSSITPEMAARAV